MSKTQLQVPYHRQDKDYYCGPACAQMVLRLIGPKVREQSTELYTYHSDTSDSIVWSLAPDSLAKTLNKFRPNGFTNSFKHFGHTKKATVARKLVWALYHYQVAPIVLVNGDDHWVVVTNCGTNVEPKSSTDSSYSINWFEINNPWAAAKISEPLDPKDATPGEFLEPPTNSPPPHFDGDSCGKGDASGIAHQHIDYEHWKNGYMNTPVPADLGSKWKGQYLAVWDPAVGEFDSQLQHDEPSQPPVRRYQGDQLIQRESEIQQASVEGLRRHGMYEREPWRSALLGTSPGKPILVQELDRMDSFYYLVPMQTDKQTTPVLVSVDARYGYYREAAAPSLGHSHRLPEFKEKELIRKLANRKLKLCNQRESLHVRKEALSVSPALVWKPCKESRSPFYPFYMLTIGAYHIYVRIDGQVFTSLDDTRHGI